MINATGNRMTREIARQSRLAQDIAQTQIQVSTGKRLQRASEDPVASTRVATIRTAQANGGAWLANVKLGQSLTAQADSVLRTASDLLARAKELTIAGANGALSAADRASLATGLMALADEMDGLSATSAANGEALFSSGTARMMRFDGEALFVPVASRAALFESNGQFAAQHIRDAASMVGTGNAAGVGGALTALDGAIDQMATAQAQIGLNAARLDRLAELHAERGITHAAERAACEDTDLTTAIAKLNAQTITLEAAQAAFARINRRSLFDILG